MTKEIVNSGLYDQTDFYKRFVSDLLKVEKEIIIYSPFITEERFNFFAPIFEHLISKKIQLYIFTRKPEVSDSEVNNRFKYLFGKYCEMGITVLPIEARQHQKLAIIDREVLWEGSLNILSQKDSQEIMRRFKGKATAEQMTLFLQIDRNIGIIGENKLQKCQLCKAPGAWYWIDKSMDGQLEKRCLVGLHKPERNQSIPIEIKKTKEIGSALFKKVPKSETNKKSKRAPFCKFHKIPMIERDGIRGKFWGCKKFPACRYTETV